MCGDFVSPEVQMLQADTYTLFIFPVSVSRFPFKVQQVLQ